MTEPYTAIATYGLPAVLDLNAAAPLAAALLERRGYGLDLDASAVERLGGQCLQVLISAAVAWQADGAPLRLTNPSERFQADVSLLGASSSFVISPELNP